MWSQGGGCYIITRGGGGGGVSRVGSLWGVLFYSSRVMYAYVHYLLYDTCNVRIYNTKYVLYCT